MVTSRSLSAGGELSDFLPFPLALPTEFLRPTSSCSLAPAGRDTLVGRDAPAGRFSGDDSYSIRHSTNLLLVLTKCSPSLITCTDYQDH